ncbi:MAG: hypothetical protein JO174_04725 [Herbaspirillum sp.]|nr:hypothetical protein [Herbaspirillum sp.]
MSATRLQVQGFLKQLAAANPKEIILSRQRKTLEFLDELDFDMRDVVKELRQLRVEDFSYGPSQNDWGVGWVWHFGKGVIQWAEGKQVVHRVYIKLCLVLSKDGRKTTCMSFHPPEKTMTVPFSRPPVRWSV